MESFGNYELREPLAHGAIETFVARQTATGQFVLLHRFPIAPSGTHTTLWKLSLKTLMKALAVEGEEVTDFGDVE